MTRELALAAMTEDRRLALVLQDALSTALAQVSQMSASDTSGLMAAAGVADQSAARRERLISEARQAVIDQIKTALSAAGTLTRRYENGIDEITEAARRIHG